MKPNEVSNLRIIDKYLKKWGMPIQIDHHRNVQSSASYKGYVYISLILVAITCAKYSILMVSENKILNIALSNQFFYYRKENFLLCMLEAVVEASAILQKLLMMYHQSNERKMRWIGIFHQTSFISESMDERQGIDIGERMRIWCKKNFKMCHYCFLGVAFYFYLWIFVTHLIHNDIIYLLTIDLPWCIGSMFSLFFYTTQALVGPVLATHMFIYCNVHLDSLSSDLSCRRIESDSFREERESKMDISNILYKYNSLLNFMHECNEYWKNLIGISVLSSIVGIGWGIGIFPRLDRGGKSVFILGIFMMTVFFAPFFLMGDQNFQKVRRILVINRVTRAIKFIFYR